MEGSLHRCLKVGICYGCGERIERGKMYCKGTFWTEDGPARTHRLHPECYAQLDEPEVKRLLEFYEWEPGSLQPPKGE